MYNVDFHRGSASALRAITKLEQVLGSKLKWHEVVVYKNVFRDYMKHVAMQCCHNAQWHDGLKRSEKEGMPFRTTSLGLVHNNPGTVTRTETGT